MTENGYTKEEILKGERIILQVCYCSWLMWPMTDPHPARLSTLTSRPTARPTAGYDESQRLMTTTSRQELYPSS